MYNIYVEIKYYRVNITSCNLQMSSEQSLPTYSFRSVFHCHASMLSLNVYNVISIQSSSAISSMKWLTIENITISLSIIIKKTIRFEKYDTHLLILTNVILVIMVLREGKN